MMIRNRKRASAVLAAALSALALTAVAAPGAQAAGNGLWLVNLANPSFPRAVTGHSNSPIGWLNSGIKILCNLVAFSGNLTASAHAKGKFIFKGCTVNGEPACLPVSSELVTNDVLAELLLLGTVVRFKPLTGTIFEQFLFLSPGEDCGFFLGEHTTLNLTGEICAAVSADTIRLMLKTEANQIAHCPSGLKLGGNTAHVFEDNPIVITSGGSKVTTHA